MNHIMSRFTNSAMRAATIFLMAFFVVIIAAMTSAMAADKLADLLSDTSIPADLAVSGVRIGENGPVTRFVLDISQSTPFHVMTVKDPYRVVLTLPSLRWQLLPGLGQMDRGVINNFRYGSFDHSSFRVVLDLKSAAHVDSVKILPPSAADHVANYRLVIDMTAIDKSKFKPQQLGSYQPPVAVAAKPTAPEKQNVDPPVAAKPAVNKADTIKTIILDPGHGGVDPGAIGISKSYEKNITFAYVKFKLRCKYKKF
jgi:N-acetylmuramoyl-L-alanine amidase